MMVLHEDLVAVWGEDNVARVPSADLAGLGLSREARHVLAKVGLPETEGVFFTRARPELKTGADNVGRYCRIGCSSMREIGVVIDSGIVLSIRPSGGREGFINSDLERFVEFLCRVTSARRSFAGLGGDEIDAIIEDLEAELRARDPDAFGDAGNWWSLVFEQLKYGML